MKSFEVRVAVFIQLKADSEKEAQGAAEDILAQQLYGMSENDERVISYATDDVSVLPLDEV